MRVPLPFLVGEGIEFSRKVGALELRSTDYPEAFTVPRLVFNDEISPVPSENLPIPRHSRYVVPVQRPALRSLKSLPDPRLKPIKYAQITLRDPTPLAKIRIRRAIRNAGNSSPAP